MNIDPPSCVRSTRCCEIRDHELRVEMGRCKMIVKNAALHFCYYQCRRGCSSLRVAPVRRPLATILVSRRFSRHGRVQLESSTPLSSQTFKAPWRFLSHRSPRYPRIERCLASSCIPLNLSLCSLCPAVVPSRILSIRCSRAHTSSICSALPLIERDPIYSLTTWKSSFLGRLYPSRSLLSNLHRPWIRNLRLSHIQDGLIRRVCVASAARMW